MESIEQQQAQKALTYAYNTICKNSDLKLDKLLLINEGCTNLRRNGSAFCQVCSDKYHGLTAPKDNENTESK